MFSNLSKGSIIYGIETKGDIKLFTASVESVTLPYPKHTQNTFGQYPELVLDIVATIDGERRDFKQVPSNTVIADFGPETVVLSDSRDSLINYVNSMLQSSRNIVNSVEKHKTLIGQYENVLKDLNPSIANDSAVKELSSEVNSMKTQMSEILSLLKQRTPNGI